MYKFLYQTLFFHGELSFVESSVSNSEVNLQEVVCKSTLAGKSSNLNASKLGGSGVIAL